LPLAIDVSALSCEEKADPTVCSSDTTDLVIGRPDSLWFAESFFTVRTAPGTDAADCRGSCVLASTFELMCAGESLGLAVLLIEPFQYLF